MTVNPGQQTSSPAPVRTGTASTTAREGIVIVAAAIDPQPVYYVPITETLPMTYTLVGGSSPMMETAEQSENTSASPASYQEQPNNEDIVAIWEAPVALPDMLNAETAWVTPVELLAALNAEGQSFTLVLMPDEADPYVSSGLNLSTLIPSPPTFEEVQW
jgi:hypothetical protein